MTFRYYKARRFVRSEMAGEVMAFSDMFDAAVTLAEEIRSITKRHIPLQLLTDSKAPFEFISKGFRTTAREGLHEKMMYDIDSVRTNANFADSLTKPMHLAVLQRTISTGVIDTKAEQ